MNTVRTTGSNQYQDVLRPDDPRVAGYAPIPDNVPSNGHLLDERSAPTPEDVRTIQSIANATGSQYALDQYIREQYGTIENVPVQHLPQIGAYMIHEGMQNDAYSDCVQEYLDIQARMIRDIKPTVGVDRITRAEYARFQHSGRGFEECASGIARASTVKGDTTDEHNLSRVTDYQLAQAMGDYKARDFADAPETIRMRYRMALENLWDMAQETGTTQIFVEGYNGRQYPLSLVVHEGENEETAREQFIRDHDRIVGSRRRSEMWAQALSQRTHLDATAAQRMGIERYIPYAERVAGGYLDKKGVVMDARAASAQWRAANPTSGDYARKGLDFAGRTGALGYGLAVGLVTAGRKRREKKRDDYKKQAEEDMKASDRAHQNKVNEQRDALINSAYIRQTHEDRKIF